MKKERGDVAVGWRKGELEFVVERKWIGWMAGGKWMGEGNSEMEMDGAENSRS